MTSLNAPVNERGCGATSVSETAKIGTKVCETGPDMARGAVEPVPGASSNCTSQQAQSASIDAHESVAGASQQQTDETSPVIWQANTADQAAPPGHPQAAARTNVTKVRMTQV